MGTKKRILAVDDERGILNVLRIKLGLCGYEVITTTSGAEAIEIIRAQEPDVVLLDVLMPEMSGLDVLHEVRAFSRVPVIIFTAKSDIIQAALNEGANDSISKPFNPDDVVKKIEAVLNGASGEEPGSDGGCA